MRTGFRKSLRTLIVGSLVLGGSLGAAIIGEAIPASAASVVQTITVGSEPIASSSDGTHVWVSNWNDGTVTELSASTGAFIQSITVGNATSQPDGIASDGSHVWVAVYGDSKPPS